MEKETHTRFIHRRGWKGRKKKREEKRINDTCKRPVEFPRLAIFDVADGIRRQEERARQAGREGWVSGPNQKGWAYI